MSESSPDASVRVMAFGGPGQPFVPTRLKRPAIGQGEVLAKVRLATICGSDLHTFRGARSVATPSVLGHEIVAEVLAADPSVRALNADRALVAGDRIVFSLIVDCGSCHPCQAGWPQKCEHLFKYGHSPIAEHPLAGGLADAVLLVCGTKIALAPETVSDAVLAPASCATATVAAAMRIAPPRFGQQVLIFGGGLLGLTAAAFAEVAGAEVTLIDPLLERRERARHFGAKTVLAPKELDAEARFDRIYELSGQPEAHAASLAALGLLGQLVLVGAVFPSPPVPFDAEALVRRCASVHGLHNYAPQDLVAALEFLEREGNRYPFEALVSPPYALEAVDQAFEAACLGHWPRVSLCPHLEPT